MMPSYESRSVTYTRAFLTLLLDCLENAPADPLLDGAKLRLSKDPGFAFSPSTVIGDLTGSEANFTGYPAGGMAVTIVQPVNLDGLRMGGVFNHVFQLNAGAPTVTNDIYGWWINTAGVVVCGERLVGGPVPLAVPGDFLDLLAALPEAFTQ